MVDFERARAQMVESQLRSGGVTNPAILARMRALPRENFLPADRRDLAYIDDVQWLGGKASRRFMAAPATLAKLLALAEITASDRVLDIGAATGYSTDITRIGKARFDVIVVEGALAAVPDSFIAALAEGGRLVTLIQSGSVGLAHLFMRSGGEVTARAAFNAVLPPLFTAQPDAQFVF